MSTRALITVALPDGTGFSHYNHSDGYPDGQYGILARLATALGTPAAAAATAQGLTAARKVDQEATPTPQDRDRYAAYASQVSRGPDTEYYALLRDMQGDLAAMAREGIVATTERDWGVAYHYLVDFPTGTVTVQDTGTAPIPFADLQAAADNWTEEW